MSDQDSGAVYEIYAIRYGTNTRRTRGLNYIKDSRPEEPLTMDFFSWLIVGARDVFVVDTGMSAEKAALNGHDFLVSPVEVIRRLGVDPAAVKTVIMTHLHYDHTGNTDAFPQARFLLQAEEMAYVCGPYMEKPWFRHAYHVDEIQKFLGYLHAGRLTLHGRDHTVADGVSVHWVGGHCAGQEVVRVRTRRGHVVLASDAIHYYEELERGIPFAVAFNIADMLCAHDRIRDLAGSENHIIAAHDPRVLDLYPAASEGLRGMAVRVDVAPGRVAQVA
jgi:glyoxylase-like metal-dependent hydrolase (beta-lactamase superfamily II)